MAFPHLNTHFGVVPNYALGAILAQLTLIQYFDGQNHAQSSSLDSTLQGLSNGTKFALIGHHMTKLQPF
jgi:hypothetical protein